MQTAAAIALSHHAPAHLPAWAGAARLLTAACAGALATALCLPPRWQHAGAAPAAAPPAARLAPDALHALRADATMGQPYAAADLVSALLARYETGGDEAALFEALLLLDREWDRPEVLASGLIQHVVQAHCPAAALLRHYWLCEAGE